MEGKRFFRIDIAEILRSKAPRKSRYIPRFVVRTLARLIRQDEVNEILSLYGDTEGVDFMTCTMQHLNVTLVVKGEENLPAKPCIFASNHPLGGMDGICLASCIGNRYDKKIRYLVNDILYHLKPLQNIFVPINKHGAQGREAAAALNASFESDNQIITFPAGLCSRKINGNIRDLEWKKMFITKAVEHRRDIVPVYFEGKNSNLFYNIANWRKRLRIKFNIEMLFLPSEFFNAKGSTFTVHFGQPIPWQTFDSSKTPAEWAESLRATVYNATKQAS
jgi:1-acyl-sn-glycerol-3-phosphate acyltransferase